MGSVKNLILLAFFILLSGCDSPSVKGYEHIATRALSNNIYFEIYTKSHGVYGGGTVKYFLTDSLDIFEYVGKCDEKEIFNGTVLEGKVVVEKFTRRNLRNGETKLLQKKVYDLSKYK